MTTLPVSTINAQRAPAPAGRGHCGSPTPCPRFIQLGATRTPLACDCSENFDPVDHDQLEVAALVAGGMSQRDACLTVWAPEYLRPAEGGVA